MKREDATTIRIELEGKMLERFNVVKEHYGVSRNTNVVRSLISERYDKLREAHTRVIPITKELYSTLETVAEKQGLTVDQFVERICLKQMPHVEVEKKVQT
jgi:high-affinity K+ transport system ATPase subunit B